MISTRADMPRDLFHRYTDKPTPVFLQWIRIYRDIISLTKLSDDPLSKIFAEVVLTDKGWQSLLLIKSISDKCYVGFHVRRAAFISCQYYGPLAFPGSGVTPSAPPPRLALQSRADLKCVPVGLA